MHQDIHVWEVSPSTEEPGLVVGSTGTQLWERVFEARTGEMIQA